MSTKYFVTDTTKLYLSILSNAGTTYIALTARFSNDYIVSKRLNIVSYNTYVFNYKPFRITADIVLQEYTHTHNNVQQSMIFSSVTHRYGQAAWSLWLTQVQNRLASRRTRCRTLECHLVQRRPVHTDTYTHCTVDVSICLG